MTSSVLLAGLAMVLIGTADFWGATGSRHGRPLAVAGWSQVLGVPAVGLALLLIGGSFIGEDIAWGALSGVTIGLGLIALYVGFATAPVGVVSPVSAVITVAVPVVFGFLRGERPSPIAVTGIVIGLLAVAMVGASGEPHTPTSLGGVLLGVSAGLGFGLGLTFLGNTSTASGLSPLLTTRFAAGTTILLAGGIARRPLTPHRRSWVAIALAAAFGAAGMSAFTVAVQEGPLILVGVITSMFPAATVALASIVFKERLRAVQLTGVVLALAAVTMVSVG